MNSLVSFMLEIFMNAEKHVFAAYPAVECNHSCKIFLVRRMYGRDQLVRTERVKFKKLWLLNVIAHCCKHNKTFALSLNCNKILCLQCCYWNKKNYLFQYRHSAKDWIRLPQSCINISKMILNGLNAASFTNDCLSQNELFSINHAWNLYECRKTRFLCLPYRAVQSLL